MKTARLFLLVYVLTFLISVKAQTHNALRDSLAKATDKLAYRPDSIDLRLKKASWNIMLEQWAYAKDEYDKVLFLDANNIAALYYRAFVNEKQGRYKFARLDYESLLKLVPGNFHAQLGLALLNQKDKHFTDAYDQINRLVSQNPDSAVAYAARAGIEKERGMLDLSEYDYGQAILRDPKETDYILNRADVRIMLRRYDDAKADLETLVRMGTPKAALSDLYKRIRKK